MARSIGRGYPSSAVVASTEGDSWDTDARRAISPRAVCLRAASPEACARPPRRARASSPDALPVRKTKNHRLYRRASHLRPGPGHATRGRGAGDHRQAAEQAVRGARRARERHGVTRVTSHVAHSRVPGAQKGTGHLEAREPPTRTRLGSSAPCPPAENESTDRKMPDRLNHLNSPPVVKQNVVGMLRGVELFRSKAESARRKYR